MVRRCFFFSSRRRHTRCLSDWSSDVCSSDLGLLAPELAAGIQRVKSAKCIGVRAGNWLSLKQAQTLLNAPDISTLKGLRDRAIIAVLLGCALRRSEVAALTMAHIQQRDGRWCIVDLY